jgi:DNA-binding transcriptional LysR family regulator
MMSNLTIGPRQLKGAKAFVAVATTGSFRAAADRLGLSVSAVSQAVRELEADLKVALLTRTTRSTALTPAGRSFLSEVEPVLKGLSEAFAAVQGNAGAAQRLALTTPSVLAPLLIDAVVGPFCAEHPDVEIELSANDRMVDVVRDGFDGGFRLGEFVALDMVAVRLSPPFPFAVVASPAYLARHGTPDHPRDLADHRCIRVRSASSGEIYRWEFAQGDRPLSVSVSGGMVVDTTEANLAAARAGLGLAYSAAPLVAAAIGRGELISLLEDSMPSSDGVHLYYPRHRQGSPTLKTFAGFARNRFKLADAVASS